MAEADAAGAFELDKTAALQSAIIKAVYRLGTASVEEVLDALSKFGGRENGRPAAQFK